MRIQTASSRGRVHCLAFLFAGLCSATLACGTSQISAGDSADADLFDATEAVDASPDIDASDLILDEIASANPLVQNLAAAITALPSTPSKRILPVATETALQGGSGCYHTQSIQPYGDKRLISTTGFTNGYIAVVAPDNSSKAVVLSSRFNHAGGFQMVGDLMVMSFENHCSMAANPDASKVVSLYDMSDPYNPVHFEDYDLVIPKNGSQAVGAVHMGDSILISVVTGRDKLQFWRLKRGQTQWESVGDWDASDAGWSIDADDAVNCSASTDWCWPQNVNLVQEVGGDVYLLAFSAGPAGERVGMYRLQDAAGDLVAPLKGSERFLPSVAGSTFRSSAGSLVKDTGTLELFGFGAFFCSAQPCTTAIARWAP